MNRHYALIVNMFGVAIASPSLLITIGLTKLDPFRIFWWMALGCTIMGAAMISRTIMPLTEEGPTFDEHVDRGLDIIREAAETQAWNDITRNMPELAALNIKPRPRHRHVPIDHETAALDAHWKRMHDGAGE